MMQFLRTTPRNWATDRFFKKPEGIASVELVREQPEPIITGKSQIVLDAVVADLIAKAEEGKLKYGGYLTTHNGRDALIDAYQEALDLCMYLRQVIMERDSK